METATGNRLIQAMQQPGFYDHPVAQVELIETHISWVFLAGDFAYKVKKPVNFGFLDFSTLARRQHFCLEELRLNRRFAPRLYLDVKAIGGDPASPRMNATPVLDYAVKMKRFEQQDQLDRVLTRGRLDDRQLACFSTMIAKVHQIAAVSEAEQPYGTPQSIIEPVLENFNQVRSLLAAAECRHLGQLEEWSRRTHGELYELLRQRKRDGFVRECHGDLHLANMAWVDGEPILFDCIEFNENLRWIDVINDIAFLFMDLADRGQKKLGWSFLNHYLQKTGDYQGLQLLRFYAVYRAMVRAKVNCLRLAQPGLSEYRTRAGSQTLPKLSESGQELHCKATQKSDPHARPFRSRQEYLCPGAGTTMRRHPSAVRSGAQTFTRSDRNNGQPFTAHWGDLQQRGQRCNLREIADVSRDRSHCGLSRDHRRHVPAKITAGQPAMSRRGHACLTGHPRLPSCRGRIAQPHTTANDCRRRRF